MTGNPAEQVPGSYMPVSPDPTKLTTEAVDRATSVFRRELQALRETIEARLHGADEDRYRMWERLRDLPQLYESFTGNLRDDLLQRDTHDRELAEQRLSGIDRATELLAGETARVAAAATADRNLLRDEMLAKAQALRELVEQRLDAMDTAGRVLAASVEKFPSDVDRAVANMREVVAGEIRQTREVLTGEIRRVQNVMEEKFTAVDAQFSSNDKALTAALAAQEKAAAEQQKSNTLAIDKSEKNTQEQSKANQAQTQAASAAQADTIADLKERVVRIESTGAGASARRTEARADTVQQHGSIQLGIAAFAVIIALISIAVTIIIATNH